KPNAATVKRRSKTRNLLSTNPSFSIHGIASATETRRINQRKQGLAPVRNSPNHAPNRVISFLFFFPFLFLSLSLSLRFPSKMLSNQHKSFPTNTSLLSRPGLQCMYKKAGLSQFVVVTVVSGRQTCGY
ncbi:LOW QUALITY PROTEIN: hypothetical protein N5P37_010618, partial [Trichoderma harzianum]